MTLSERISYFWNKHVTCDEVPRDRAHAERQMVDRWSAYDEHREGMLRVPEYGTLLDYGCGCGFDLVTNARPGGLQIGMDVSYRALERAEARRDICGVAAQLSHIGENAELPLRAGEVDGVFCAGVLHHVIDPEWRLSEFHRVTRPGGWIKISFHNRSSVFYQMQSGWLLRGEKSREQAFADYAEGGGCPLARVWFPREVEVMLTRAGYGCINYLGGYTNVQCRGVPAVVRSDMLESDRVDDEGREFAANCTDDLYYRGKLAGLMGVIEARRT